MHGVNNQSVQYQQWGGTAVIIYTRGIVLDSESSSSVSNPDQGHCVEFLCKTLTSHGASFSPTKVTLQRGTLGFAELL